MKPGLRGRVGASVIVCVALCLTIGGVVDSADTAPTQPSYEVFEELSKQLDEQLAKWREIQSKDVPALNDSMRKENLGPVLIAPVKRED